MVNSQFGKVVLAVDLLVGEIQTVVKPLDVILQQSQLFSGIVRVAEKDIGFVLDINKLVLKAQRQKQLMWLGTGILIKSLTAKDEYQSYYQISQLALKGSNLRIVSLNSVWW